jgi:hypothetical protein
MKRLNGIPGDMLGSADIRDQALGAALRGAVGSLADVDEAALLDSAERAVAEAAAGTSVSGDGAGVRSGRGASPVDSAAISGRGALSGPGVDAFRRFRRSIRRLPFAAAAAVIVGVGAAGAGVGIGLSGRADARANASMVAGAILPEYSRWVPEAMDGDPDPAGPMAEFVESLWASGGSGGGGPFGPVY